MFLRYGWFCVRCHFPMSMFLRLGSVGWYCVTKGSIFLRAFLFLCSSALFLSAKMTSERFLMFSSKVISEEFVPRRLKASPLMKPFVTLVGD